LTSINGYLELVLDRRSGALADEQREFLSIVARNTDRLRKLVDDLLLISEIDAGKLKLDVGDLDLRALTQESLESARPQAVAGGVSLTLAAGAPVQLTGDRLRLGQLLDNMISNAIKFTPPGGSVSLRMSRSNGTELVEVEDTGIGMSVSEENDVFDRFYRTRAADEGAIQGTGLGLSISQAIAHAHGGQIDVSSTENVGTTFCVALPAKT
jgi:signal transduction histidine kinase